MTGVQCDLMPGESWRAHLVEIVDHLLPLGHGGAAVEPHVADQQRRKEGLQDVKHPCPLPRVPAPRAARRVTGHAGGDARVRRARNAGTRLVQPSAQRTMRRRGLPRRRAARRAGGGGGCGT